MDHPSIPLSLTVKDFRPSALELSSEAFRFSSQTKNWWA
jgi:hypothetical protein